MIIHYCVLVCVIVFTVSLFTHYTYYCGRCVYRVYVAVAEAVRHQSTPLRRGPWPRAVAPPTSIIPVFANSADGTLYVCMYVCISLENSAEWIYIPLRRAVREERIP